MKPEQHPEPHVLIHSGSSCSSGRWTWPGDLLGRVHYKWWFTGGSSPAFPSQSLRRGQHKLPWPTAQKYSKIPRWPPPETCTAPSQASPPSNLSHISSSSTGVYRWWKPSREISFLYCNSKSRERLGKKKAQAPPTLCKPVTEVMVWSGMKEADGYFVLIFVEICYENRVLESYCAVQ